MPKCNNPVAQKLMRWMLPLSGLESEHPAQEAIAEAAEEIESLDGRLRAIVTVVGGEVEGQPTGRHNVLQRIRRLLEIEANERQLRNLTLELNRRLALLTARQAVTSGDQQ